MAKIVAGLALPHGPTIQTHWSRLNEFEQRDRTNPQLRAEPPVTFDELVKLAAETRPTIKDELTEDVWKGKYERAQRGLAVLRSVMEEAAPDVVVAIGDDQHEHLLDDNMPQFCVYWGDTLALAQRQRSSDRQARGAATDPSGAEVGKAYPAEPELAKHMIKSLIAQSFDIATSSELRPDVGLGHAFRMLYNVFAVKETPILPIMVNCFYPPNQPPPARCYAFGRALRKAIESWDSDKRVAIVGSGGLSHVIIDEEIDQLSLEAIRRQDVELIAALPEDRLIRGTSEIRNWIILAGAMEPAEMNLVDYVPVYRSSAAMGHALSFAYWNEGGKFDH